MSNIIHPNGGEPKPERPSNEAVKAAVQEQIQQQEAQALADKIVQMEAPPNAEVVERRRKQAITAFAITMQQLNEDAGLLETAAKLPGVTVQEQHQKFDTARSLRMSMTWLQGLIASEDKAPKPESN